MTRIVAFVALAGAVTLTACDSIGQAMSSHTDLLARAAGHELTVDEAAAMLAPHPQIPAQPEVIDAVANLWVDYILLATAASRDTSLATLDLDPLLQPFMEQEVVTKLREEVIAVDTLIADAELRAQYEREGAGVEVRARHILFRLDADAPPARRDSVLTRARAVRAEASAGGDFAELARAHSQDPGSAQQGGDLDYFGRGQMVQPFEDAAFALAPGEVSDVVESPFGLHIIKVEDRRQPAFDDVRDMFRQAAIDQRIGEAEEAYVRSVTEPRSIQIQEDALDVARELARKPLTQLGGRAANRPLVRYQGGALTAAEFRGVMRGWDPQQRTRLSMASDEQVDMVLQGLTRNKLLVEEGQRRGFSLSAVEQDSLRREARQQLRRAVAMTGIGNIEPQAGETMNQAIERTVGEYLQAIMRGEQSVMPLGPLTYSLREQFGGEVYERAYPTVVGRIEALRSGAAGGAPSMPPPPPATQPQPAQPQPQPRDGN